MVIRSSLVFASLCAASALLVVGCDDSREPTAPAAPGTSGRTHAVGAGASNGTATDTSDASTLANRDAGAATARRDGAFGTCAASCRTDTDCDDDQRCLELVDGIQCAPAECADCTGLCEFDLDTCVFDACFSGTGESGDEGCGCPPEP